MTLDTVLAAIKTEFPLADDNAGLADTIVMTSGGPQHRASDPVPALYASEALAAAAWLREMQTVLRVLRERKPAAIKFVDGPHLDRYEISMTAGKRVGVHRWAEPRWSVTAKVGMVAKAEKPQRKTKAA